MSLVNVKGYEECQLRFAKNVKNFIVLHAEESTNPIEYPKLTMSFNVWS